MKIKQLFTYCLLASTFLLASCDNETLPDGDGAGTPLPEGMYPLTFTATQDNSGGVQTRVSENSDGMGSQWTVGDQIKVVVSDGGNAAETTCTLDRSGNITAYNPKLYWQTTQNSKVNAWYSNITGDDATASSTVSLANQTGGLAYVLKADEKTDVNYKSSNIQLQFKHQLAKVRVKVVKGTYTGNLNITGVKVKGYTSCAVSKGVVSSGSNEGYISMRKNGDYYEANLVPGLALQAEAFEITADGNTTKATLNAAVTPARGNVHTITITMDAAGPKPITPGETITEGEYIMKGSVSQGVTLNGDNINLILEEVTSNGANPPIHITGGTPTIIIKGKNNSLTTTGGPGIWVDGENANVKITGDGSSSSCIKIESGAAAIGTKGGTYANPKCGNITIENIKIIATIKESGAAAIGFGAAYGAGSNQKIGNITITNSEIEAKLTEDQWFPYGAVVGGCGGGEGTYTMGDIRITTTNSGMTTQSYFSKCTCGDVLVGFPSSSYNPTVNSFKIYWNGQVQSGNITK